MFKPFFALATAAGLAALTATAPVAEPAPSFISLGAMPAPASAATADAYLAALFDRSDIEAMRGPLLQGWIDTAFADPATQIAMDLAGPQGIEAILSGILDSGVADTVVAAHDMATAERLFAVLFHPALLEAVANDTPERVAAWSAMADAVEGLYARDI